MHDIFNKSGAKIHLMGAGGVGVSGLAVLLKARGFSISGCDSTSNRITRWLINQGLPVFQGHSGEHLQADTEALIYSNAIPYGHPEITAAQAAGVPIFRRGEVMAGIVRRTPSIAIAGTHGKTTTTAMLIHILQSTGRNPEYSVGGEWGDGGQRMALGGTGDTLIVEADESDGTLALYAPSTAVVTNIEYDHMEHFGDESALLNCFRQFTQQAGRRVIYGADNPHTKTICAAMPNARSFGFDSEAHVRGSAIELAATGVAFDVSIDGLAQGRITLKVPGRYNVLNALAALAVAIDEGIPFDTAAQALANFQPVRRRFEFFLNSPDLMIVSDYAHHPSEIRALIQAALVFGRRVIAIFQPHRYTRTLALAPDFPPAFDGVNYLVLAPVYAASEPVLRGGMTDDLYTHFQRDGGSRVILTSSLFESWVQARDLLQRGDMLLIIGAGDVEKITDWALSWAEGRTW
jgi:UDP-N-acetylmuramate--alanine ligase